MHVAAPPPAGFVHIAPATLPSGQITHQVGLHLPQPWPQGYASHPQGAESPSSDPSKVCFTRCGECQTNKTLISYCVTEDFLHSNDSRNTSAGTRSCTALRFRRYKRHPPRLFCTSSSLVIHLTHPETVWPNPSVEGKARTSQEAPRLLQLLRCLPCLQKQAAAALRRAHLVLRAGRC